MTDTDLTDPTTTDPATTGPATTGPTTTALGPVVRVADVPPNLRRGSDIRVTLSSRTVGATSGFGGTLRMRPGDFVSEHYHPYSEEFLHVVTGELELQLDHVTVALRADDAYLVPIGRRHRLTNVGDSEAHVIFHLSPLAPRPDLGHVDTEELPLPGAPQLRVDPR